MIDYGDRWTNWLKSHPLEIWRENNGVTVVNLAAWLNKGQNTLYLWLRGIHKPGDPETWEKLMKLTQNKDLRTEWDEWFDNRPQMEDAI